MPDELVHFDSFDHYATADATAKWVQIGNGGLFSITTGRTNNGARFGATSQPSITLPAEHVALNAGVAYRTEGFANSIFEFKNLRYHGNLQAKLEHIGDGRLRVVFGPDSDLVPGFVMHLDRWYHIGFRAELSDAGGGVLNCDCLVYVNGRQIASIGLSQSMSGVGAPNWAEVLLGAPGGGNVAHVDDLWITNGIFLGDLRIYVIRPDGLGDSSDWDVTGAGSNWEAKDDATPDYDASYIDSDTIGDKELQELEDITALGPIKGAQALWMADKSEAGAGAYEGILKVGGIEFVAGEDYPSYASWLYMRIPYLKSPDTGAAWTESEINAMQQGEERIG